MRKKYLPVVIIIAAIIGFSCGNSGPDTSGKLNLTETVTQSEDGTISLKLEKASRYKCTTDPSNNTAEWNFVVSKPGRYNVWLSTATTDTMDLQYESSVKISLLDELLEAKPVGDRIVLGSNDVKAPYFRADSFMGSVNIMEAGEYSIQVISEKVEEGSAAMADMTDRKTKMMSVILTPLTR